MLRTDVSLISSCFSQRRVRSSREVIVQRAEVERREAREGREGREGRMREVRDGREGRDGRGDEWADPWMRAEPAARRRKPQSSEDSYSSSRYVYTNVYLGNKNAWTMK